MRKKSRRGNQAKIGILVIIAVVVLAGVILWRRQSSSAQATEPEQTDQSEETVEGDITWNGKWYNYNTHLSNYLFIGVDNREKVETNTGHANAGQCDALYLVAWDRVEKTATIISIPRDTITEIETFGPGGESLGKTNDHISLSYAYGDGKYESCELAKQAVSNLFYGLSIQGYCSLNMDGLPLLTESVGGVTVTVPNDSLESKYPEFKKGAQVTLTKETTEPFVRYRDTTVSQSAITRMERQQVFIRAFGEAAKKKFAENPAFITQLYSDLEPYMVTNMGADDFSKVMQGMNTEDEGSAWTVPGKGTEGEDYDEYIVDDDALYEKIIETFYTEVEEK